MSADKILFLDFDGVLNSKAYLETHFTPGVCIDPSRLALVYRIVSETGAKIVLSTSWRTHWDGESARTDETGRAIDRLFAEAGLAVFDKTPVCGRRYDEIAAWLNAHESVKRFVVLDDEPFEEGVLRDHFVLVSRLRRGLDEDDVMKAIDVLNADAE